MRGPYPRASAFRWAPSPGSLRDPTSPRKRGEVAVASPALEQQISYAQRYEDIHLLRAFGDQPDGFYIDIGAGHPVYDNVSFAFYLRGWRGITVEPNPWLAQLSEAVRPRDIRIASLVGDRAPERATYYLVEDFHGLSTTVEGHARGRTERIRQKLAGDDDAGHDLAGAVRAARSGRHRFSQDRRRGRRARCAARRRLAAIPAEGRRAGGAGPGHHGAGVAGLGAAADRARLSLRVVRRPQSLLTSPRNAPRWATGSRLRRHPWTASPNSGISSPRRTTPAIRITNWPACWPGSTWSGCRCCPMTRSWIVSSAALIEPIWIGRCNRPTRRRPTAGCSAPSPPGHTPRAAAGRHPPRSLPQCGGERIVPGRLRAHLRKLGLVTIPSYPRATTLWLAVCIPHPL